MPARLSCPLLKGGREPLPHGLPDSALRTHGGRVFKDHLWGARTPALWSQSLNQFQPLAYLLSCHSLLHPPSCRVPWPSGTPPAPTSACPPHPSCPPRRIPPSEVLSSLEVSLGAPLISGLIDTLIGHPSCGVRSYG